MQAPFFDPLLALQHAYTVLPLVGRDSELRTIQSLIDTVALDIPQGARALTITGEMGIGKSRLLATACLAARERGLLVLESSAYEASQMFPYFPFIEALRPVLRSASLEQLRRYLGFVREPAIALAGRDTRPVEEISQIGQPLLIALTRLFPELPTLLRLDTPFQSEVLTPDQEKFRLFDAVATLLEKIAQERPVLLATDNLQWADSASLELTLYLTVRLRRCRVALIGVTRPPRPRTGDATPHTSSSENATRILGDLMRNGLLALLVPGPLSSEAIVQHIHALLPGSVPGEVEQALLERAEGNPFFLEELVRSLTLNNQLVLRNGAWKAAQISSMKLPDSIVLAVEQRLQGLSSTCHELLLVASLFGRTFPLEALLQIVGQEHEQVQRTVDEAVQASVIARVAAVAQEDEPYHAPMLENTTHESLLHLRRPTLQLYIFSQGIVHEALLASVPANRTKGLHAAIGRALEACYAHEASTHAAELAHHYALGGIHDATLHWSLLAGEEALRQQAHREAISHFRTVLRLLETGDDSHKNEMMPMPAELHLIIGEIWFTIGELGNAVSSFQQTLALLSQQAGGPSPLLLARTNRLLSDVYRMQAKYEQAIAHLKATRAALDQVIKASNDETGELVRTVPWLPGRNTFNLAAAPTAFQERMSREHMSEHIQFHQAQAMLDLLLGRADEAEHSLWQSHQLAIEASDRGSQAFALHLVGWIRGWGEHIYESIRLQEQAHELYISIGDPFRASLGDQSLGIIHQTLGEMEQARLYTLRGLERARRYGVRRMIGLMQWNMGSMSLAQGDWENGASAFQEALQEATSNSDARLKALTLQAYAELRFRQGNWNEAEHLFQDALQAGANTDWLPGTIALYGHFLAVTGRRAQAKAQLDRAVAYPEPTGLSGHFYIPFLAEAFLHLDDPERAATYIERIQSLKGFMYYGNSIDRILGVVAVHVGDWSTAEEAFTRGLQLCQRAQNRPEEAAILYEQARAALTHGDSVRRINELCDQARAIFAEFQMQRAVDMVDILREGARQLEQQQADQQDKPGREQQQKVQSKQLAAGYSLELTLTKRELEVLRLVAEGHTDREVAETLIISPRTANRHLSNIFVKLDVPGRAAAVAYAIRMGLV